MIAMIRRDSCLNVLSLGFFGAGIGTKGLGFILVSGFAGYRKIPFSAMQAKLISWATRIISEILSSTVQGLGIFHNKYFSFRPADAASTTTHSRLGGSRFQGVVQNFNPEISTPSSMQPTL